MLKKTFVPFWMLRKIQDINREQNLVDCLERPTLRYIFLDTPLTSNLIYFHSVTGSVDF